ncbi:hypothetical protein B7486_43955 [cyanobacterium TDX16]|nr:hypothetical protein B7486_43955 [cyanobacterium TDX16]
MVIGKVSWFGGLNKKTGKVNNIGYLTPIGEDLTQDICVYRKDVPSQLQAILEPGVYVQFEIVIDRNDKKRAINIELVPLVGIINWFDMGRGYITCEDRSDVRVEASENFQSGEVVFFYLKHNSKSKRDEAILVQKVNRSTEARIIIEKCAKSNKPVIFRSFIVKYAAALSDKEAIKFILEKIRSFSTWDKQSIAKSLIDKADRLLLASSELRRLLISDNRGNLYSYDDISTYCRFINKHINSINEFSNQKLLKEFLDIVRQADDSLRVKYWSEVNFLKEGLKYRGDYWDIAPTSIKTNLIKEAYQKFFEIISQFDKSEYPFAQSLSCS